MNPGPGGAAGQGALAALLAPAAIPSGFQPAGASPSEPPAGEPAFAWAQVAGGVGQDGCHGIVSDAEDSVYIVGSFTGSASFFHTNLTAASGRPEYFAAKYDRDGRFLWARDLNLSTDYPAPVPMRFVGANLMLALHSATGARLLTLSQAGEISSAVNCGSVNFPYHSAIDQEGGVGTIGGGSSSLVVARRDSQGTPAYEKSFPFIPGGTHGSPSVRLCVLPDKRAVFALTFEGTFEWDSGSISTTGQRQAVIVWLNSDGSVLMVKRFSNLGFGWVDAIAADPAGNVCVTGAFSETADFDGRLISRVGALGNLECFAVKYDSDGNQKWALNLGGRAGMAVAMDDAGVVTIAGNFQWNSTIGGIWFPGAGADSAFVCQLDPDGATKWAKRSQGTGVWPSAVYAAPDGRVCFGGFFGSDAQRVMFDTIALKGLGINAAFAAVLAPESPLGQAPELEVDVAAIKPLYYEDQPLNARFAFQGSIPAGVTFYRDQTVVTNVAMKTYDGGGAFCLIPNLRTSDSGRYYAVATNLYGSATSQVFQIDVEAATLTTRLVAYYPFDGDAHDASGHGLDGIVHGPANTVTGVQSNAFYFNGTNCFLEVPSDPLLELSNTMTISLWVKPMTNTAASLAPHMGIFSKHGWSDAGIANADYALVCNKQAHSPFLMHSSGGFGLPEFKVNQWNHMVVFLGDGKLATYLNGTESVISTAWGDFQTSTNSLCIGSTYPTIYHNLFHGMIDELRIYDRPLSKREIQMLGAAFGINVEPQDRVVRLHADASFTVQPSSGSLLCQWYASPNTLIAGATNLTLLITDVTEAKTGGYYALLTSTNGGSVRSRTAALTIGTPPRLVREPADTVTVLGQSALLSLSAEGIPPIKYQWHHQNDVLPGATEMEYAITNCQVADQGGYFCVVTNDYGGVTSRVAALTVDTPPSIALSPGPAEAQATSNLTLSVTADGTRPLSYQWFFNDTVLLSAATNDTLTLTNVQLPDAGGYVCVVSNRYGAVTSEVATVTVTLPNPAVLVNGWLSPSNRWDVPGIPGASVELRTTFTNRVRLFYSLDGSDPAFAQPYTEPFRVTNSVVVRVYVLREDTYEDAYGGPVTINAIPAYFLTLGSPGGGWVVADAPGPYTSNTLVTVQAVASNGWTFLNWAGDAAGTDPVLELNMDQPREVQAVFGTAMTNNVVPSGSGSVRREPDLPLYPFGTRVRLTGLPNAGRYFNFWGNGGAGTNANPLISTVTNPGPNVSAVFGSLTGSSQSFTVVVEGQGTVDRSPPVNVLASGSSVVLTAMPSEGWEFDQWSGDAGGSENPLSVLVETNVLVKARFVYSAPTILAEPATQTALVGGSAEFSVEAGGRGPLSYQWWKGSAPLAADGRITGVTSPVLNLSSVRADDAGLYRVVVTNLMGSATSSVARLTVVLSNSPPQIALTSPTNGAAYTFPASVPCEAGASDPDGTVARVDFFGGANLLGSATNAPYALVWSNASAGTYPVYAVACDNLGLTSTSAPVTVTIAPAVLLAPVVRLESATYSVAENAGYVEVVILKNANSSNATVNFATANGSARAVGTEAGDYYATSGSLTLTNGQTASAVRIPLSDDTFYEGDQFLTFNLIGVSEGASLGSPSQTMIAILDDDQPSSTNSLTSPVVPATVAAGSGALKVFLQPAIAGGQWRFLWEVAWRNSGTTASGLVPGNYPVEFRPVSGFVQPPLTTNIVMVGALTVETNTYTVDAVPETGGLSVVIQPASVANALEIGQRGQWRLQGTGDWLDSGTVVSNLTAGDHIVEFKPVPGFSTPPGRVVVVGPDQENGLAVVYLLAASAPGSGPSEIANFDEIRDSLVNGLPFCFNGQLLTDAGFGSGAVVKRRVVLTAAHVVFNDASMSYAETVWWFFQRQRGEYEPLPLQPRGWYVASGYASQRTNDASAGVSSPAAQDLDVAALFFTADAGRGGYGGYLTSDQGDNEWLMGSALKILVGYPVEGVLEEDRGRLHWVAPGNYGFAHMPGASRVYTTTGMKSFPGNSGGPLCVLYNGRYYPAGVYLGGSGQSAVRAIDHTVVDLINRAEITANTGDNNTGGGVITVTTGGSGVGTRAYVTVRLGPPAAVAAGAAWRLQGETAWLTNANSLRSVSKGGSTAIEFRNVPGWELPKNQAVTLVLGQTAVIDGTYLGVAPVLSGPALLDDRQLTFTVSGSPGIVYLLEASGNLGQTYWQSIATNDMDAAGVWQFSEPASANQSQRFYRARQKP